MEASLSLAGESSSVSSAGAARKLNNEQDVDTVVDAYAETNSASDVEEYVCAQQSQRLPRELNKSPMAVKMRHSRKSWWICILIRIVEQGRGWIEAS